MTDFDSIWRTQDEIRTVVNAVMGECIWNLSYEHLRMCIVEMPSVIMSVYCECPSTSLPSHGAIEMVQCYILVILPRSQHKAEVCIAAIPPDAKHVTMTVQAHQEVEVDLVDCLILCSGKVQLVGHLVAQEQSLVLCCVVALLSLRR